jgi:hypothetical protein
MPDNGLCRQIMKQGLFCKIAYSDVRCHLTLGQYFQCRTAGRCVLSVRFPPGVWGSYRSSEISCNKLADPNSDVSEVYQLFDQLL